MDNEECNENKELIIHNKEKIMSNQFEKPTLSKQKIMQGSNKYLPTESMRRPANWSTLGRKPDQPQIITNQ